MNTSTLGKPQLFIRIALLMYPTNTAEQNNTILVYLQLKPPSHTLFNWVNEEEQ